MTPLQALAQAVEAGKAGIPLAPEALAELGAVLQALQGGADPARVLRPPKPRGRPRGIGTKQIEAMAAMAELMHRKGKTPEQAARQLAKQFHVSVHTLYDNWWRGKGDTRKVLRKGKPVSVWRAKGVTLAHDRAEDAAEEPQMLDRPNASEEFKG